jgi:Nucleolar protein,Nop52
LGLFFYATDTDMPGAIIQPDTTTVQTKTSEDIHLPSLVHSNPQTRNAELKKLDAKISKLSTQFDSMKLAKGLFYCYWMTPLPAAQEPLAQRIAASCTPSFASCMLQTISKEWYSIDKHRLDKIYLLVKQIILAQEIDFSLLPTTPLSLFSYCVIHTIPRMPEIPIEWLKTVLAKNEQMVTNAVMTLFECQFEKEELEKAGYALYTATGVNSKTRVEVKKALDLWGKENDVVFTFEKTVTQFKTVTVPIKEVPLEVSAKVDFIKAKKDGDESKKDGAESRKANKETASPKGEGKRSIDQVEDFEVQSSEPVMSKKQAKKMRKLAQLQQSKMVDGSVAETVGQTTQEDVHMVNSEQVKAADDEKAAEEKAAKKQAKKDKRLAKMQAKGSETAKVETSKVLESVVEVADSTPMETEPVQAALSADKKENVALAGQTQTPSPSKKNKKRKTSKTSTPAPLEGWHTAPTPLVVAHVETPASTPDDKKEKKSISWNQKIRVKKFFKKSIIGSNDGAKAVDAKLKPSLKVRA